MAVTPEDGSRKAVRAARPRVRWYEREHPVHLGWSGFHPRFVRWLPVAAIVVVAVGALPVPESGIGFAPPSPLDLLLEVFLHLEDPVSYLVPVALVLGVAVALRYPLATLASFVFGAAGIGLVVCGSVWSWTRFDSDRSLVAPGVAFGLAIAAGLVGLIHRRAGRFDRLGAALGLAIAAGSAFLMLFTYGACAETRVVWSGFRADLAETELGWLEPPDPTLWLPRLLIASDGRAVVRWQTWYDPDEESDDGHELEKWLATVERRMKVDGSEWLALHVERDAPLDSVLLTLERARRCSVRVRFAALGEPGRYAGPPLFRPRAERYRIFDLPFPPEGFDSPAADAVLVLPPGTRWEGALRRVERELGAGARTVSLRLPR